RKFQGNGGLLQPGNSTSQGVWQASNGVRQDQKQDWELLHVEDGGRSVTQSAFDAYSDSEITAGQHESRNRNRKHPECVEPVWKPQLRTHDEPGRAERQAQAHRTGKRGVEDGVTDRAQGEPTSYPGWRDHFVAPGGSKMSQRQRRRQCGAVPMADVTQCSEQDSKVGHQREGEYQQEGYTCGKPFQAVQTDERWLGGRF